MEKIVAVVNQGLVASIFGSFPPGTIDIEILDMDTQDEDERNAAEERLDAAEQHLTCLY